MKSLNPAPIWDDRGGGGRATRAYRPRSHVITGIAVIGKAKTLPLLNTDGTDREVHANLECLGMTSVKLFGILVNGGGGWDRF
jgi:hypothetical protein